MTTQAGIHPCEQPHGHEVQHDGIDAVQQQIGQMVAHWIETPDEVIDAKGEPSQWLIVTHVKCSKHPLNIRPVKPPVEQIFNDVLVVIPINKLILGYRIKGGYGQDNDDDGDGPVQ